MKFDTFGTSADAGLELMREMQLLAIEGEDAHKQIYIDPLFKKVEQNS